MSDITQKLHGLGIQNGAFEVAQNRIFSGKGENNAKNYKLKTYDDRNEFCLLTIPKLLHWWRETNFVKIENWNRGVV